MESEKEVKGEKQLRRIPFGAGIRRGRCLLEERTFGLAYWHILKGIKRFFLSSVFPFFRNKGERPWALL